MAIFEKGYRGRKMILTENIRITRLILELLIIRNSTMVATSKNY